MSSIINYVKTFFGCRSIEASIEEQVVQIDVPLVEVGTASSSSGDMRSTPVEVLCLSTLPKHDSNSAFAADGIYSAFRTQLKVDVELHHCETFPEAIARARGRTYQVVHERRHGSCLDGVLSQLPGGSISTAPADLKLMRQLCGLVKPGGLYIVEGCQAGLGKDNLLKHIASHSPPGVRVVGAKGSIFYLDAPFSHQSHMYNYIRFYESNAGYGVTRYYQRTASGKVQNIPEDELFFLWEILSPKGGDSELSERAFDMCFNLLAERHDPEGFARVVAEHQALIEQLIGDPERIVEHFRANRRQLINPIDTRKEDTKQIWQQMLTDLSSICSEIVYDSNGRDTDGICPNRDLCVPYSGVPDLVISRKDIDGNPLEDSNGTIRSISNPRHPYAKAYSFLLGCGLIDKYKVLFMLLDNQQPGSNPATLAISALSDLAVHGGGATYEPVRVMLAHNLQLIKDSYRVAKNQGALKSWFLELSKGVCFNRYLESLRAFHYEHLTAAPAAQLHCALMHWDVRWIEDVLKTPLSLQSRISIDLSVFERALGLNDGLLMVRTLLNAQIFAFPAGWLEKQITQDLHTGNFKQALDLIELFYSCKDFNHQVVEKRLESIICCKVHELARKRSFEECKLFFSKIPDGYLKNQLVESVSFDLIRLSDYTSAIMIAEYGVDGLMNRISNLLYNRGEYALAIEAAKKNKESWRREEQCDQLYRNLMAYPIMDYEHARLAALGLSDSKDAPNHQGRALLAVCDMQLEARISNRFKPPLECAKEAAETAALIPDQFVEDRDIAFNMIANYVREKGYLDAQSIVDPVLRNQASR